MPKKKVNPRRIPLAKSAINKNAIIEEAMENDMAHAWLLVGAPLLDEGYELRQLADAVNRYIDKTAEAKNKRELLRAEAALGIVQPRLDADQVRSPVELEAFKKKVRRVAVNTALCIIYLGLESLIPAETLRRIFFSADLTLAEVEQEITDYGELERELLRRVAEIGKVEDA